MVCEHGFKTLKDILTIFLKSAGHFIIAMYDVKLYVLDYFSSMPHEICQIPRLPLDEDQGKEQGIIDKLSYIV